jgi:sugar phosphate isomerase/epimerase
VQLLPSTTSHKHEALVPTLEVFARLGFHDLDLNLNHIIERGTPVDAVRRALSENGQRVSIVSGGWCDFFDGARAIERTLGSVERQAALTREFGADRLRLFFGRLAAGDYSRRALAVIVDNIRGVADRHVDLLFAFENHDGASSRPEICRDILAGVDRPNVALTFDPINFEHRGVRALDAFRTLQPFVAHVHLKGYSAGAFCGFGEGDVDLTPTLRALIGGGYHGAFTVEYEGSGDRTLRLYQSVHRARAALNEAVSYQLSAIGQLKADS